MTNLLINLALAHKEYLYGIATGYAIAHIPEAVLYLFKLAMRVPWLRAAILSNPKQSKEIIDSIARELDKDIDAEVAAEQPAALPPAGK